VWNLPEKNGGKMKRTIIILIITILCVHGLLANADLNINLSENSKSKVTTLADLINCNYYRYEAEYSEVDERISPEGDEDEGVSRFYYRINRNDAVKEFQQKVYTQENNNYSFQSSHRGGWECKPIAGVSYPSYAAQDLLWKWTQTSNYKGFNAPDIPLVGEVSSAEINNLFFNYSMYIPENDLADTTKVCKVRVYALVQEPDSARKRVYLPTKSYLPQSFASNILTVADFANAPYNPIFPNFKLFTYYIAKQDIPAALIGSDSEESIINLNFEVYWYNNVKLLIDYFEIYDDEYMKFKNGQ
jgi:hypothetical protein